MSAFETYCSDIVKEYVQTVLIIDDGAGLQKKQKIVNDADIQDPDDDIQDPLVTAEDPPIFKIEDDQEDEIDEEENSHPLQTLELTNAFYDLGIVAGLFQPQLTEEDDPEEFASKAKSVSATADIIILDWMLRDHDARYSQAIVKQILEQDNVLGGRLRTILIYTGEPALNDIRDELWTFLDKDALDNTTDYEINSNNLNITFYNKVDATGSPRVVAEEDLPLKAIADFATLVDGLVPAFAMKATSTIRQNTGALLAKFDSSLDCGYLAHRALLPNPDDSEVLMLENYASYLRNILALAQVDRQTLGYDKIEEWVDEKHAKCHKKADISGDVIKEITFSKENFLESFKHGFTVGKKGLFKAIQKHTSQPRAKAIVKVIANIEHIVGTFGFSKGAVKKSSQALSSLTSFRRTYNDLRVGYPYLTQGSLIRSITENSYFLCVMPKCDTDRVKNKRNFLFAKLTINDGEYDLIAPDITQNGAYIHLKTNLKFYQLEDIEFDAKGSAKVEASENAGDVVFESIQGQKYQWIGDLEDLNIQNKVSSIVGDFNRVGVDEIEWVRRRKK